MKARMIALVQSLFNCTRYYTSVHPEGGIAVLVGRRDRTLRDRRGKSHPANTGMRGYDLPAVGKLLEIHDAVSHDRLLGAWESD